MTDPGKRLKSLILMSQNMFTFLDVTIDEVSFCDSPEKSILKIAKRSLTACELPC